MQKTDKSIILRIHLKLRKRLMILKFIVMSWLGLRETRPSVFTKLLSEKFNNYLKRVRKDAPGMINVFSKIIYNVIRSTLRGLEFNFAIKEFL